MLASRRRPVLRAVSNLLLLELLILFVSVLARAAGPPSVGAFANRATVYSVAGDIISAFAFLNIFILPTALLYLCLVPVLVKDGQRVRKRRLRALMLTPVGFPFAYLAAGGGAQDARPLTVVAALALPVLFALLMRLPDQAPSRHVVAGGATALATALIVGVLLATQPG